MAIELFLKLTGIDGESTDAKHKGEIDVLAWSWGLSHEVASTGGGATGRTKIESVSIQKLVDLASPLLLSASAQSKSISDGMLTTRKAGKGGGEFLLFKMTNVVVTSVNVAASETTDAPTESVNLSFSKLEFTYRATNPNGTPGTEKSFRLDVTSGKT
jgi:type VI secretion system secreted protein Hcp